MTYLICKIEDVREGNGKNSLFVDVIVSARDSDIYAKCTLMYDERFEGHSSCGVIHEVYNDKAKNPSNLQSEIYEYFDIFGDDIVEVARTLYSMRGHYKDESVKKARYSVVFE